ncbi:MAG: glycine C-acetyltransferase [Gammaproteobacteria bacterium]|jgi:glycine C-acetyltransferase|nr:glycine C-acetyltransferase [Gammaproteobacteria bacterium]
MKKLKFMEKEIERLREIGLYNKIKTIDTPQGAWLGIEGKKVLNMCSNNYLGLANHPEIINHAKNIMDEFGVGPGAVRSIAGTMTLHKELERLIAKFKNVEGALAVQSCFMANQAVIPSINPDAIFTDELNHASIIDGVRLTKSKRFIYEHNNMKSLQEKLEEGKNFENKIIITDGVFSMDGDIAKLDEISKLAEEYEALLMVDDAHGEGVLGDHGRGIVNHFGLSDKEVDIDIGSLSKAVGVVGGYIAGSNTLIDYMQQKGRPYLFSSALTVPDVAATIAAINLILRDDSLVKKLWENTEYFQKAVREIGFDIGRTQTPITPIMIGEVKKSAEFSKKLFDDNIFATSLGFPTVPKGLARVRVMLSAAHSIEDLDFAIEKFEKVGKELQII